VLNALQRRLSLAVWSNLNTSASYIYIYILLCAHRYYYSGCPYAFLLSLSIGSHFYFPVTHLPSSSPWALGTFYNSGCPQCLLRVLEHWGPFSKLYKTPCFLEKPWIQVSINHHALLSILKFTMRYSAFSKFPSKMHASQQAHILLYIYINACS